MAALIGSLGPMQQGLDCPAANSPRARFESAHQS